MTSAPNNSPVEGRNGVVIAPHERPAGREVGYRTYEVHQRERVGESTEKIKNSDLMSDAFRRDPYPTLAILRDNYPFYRDWLANCYWLTPYNDVTSVFVDDANFETRSKMWSYGLQGWGRDFNSEVGIAAVEEQITDSRAPGIAERIIAGFPTRGSVDLAKDFAARFSLELLCELYAVPAPARDEFCALFWRTLRGVSWSPALRKAGAAALRQLVAMVEPWLKARVEQPGDDVISALVRLSPDTGSINARDVVVTLLERDHETLHGALANLWFLLLTHPVELDKARSERRLMKLAYLETLRHSTPVLAAKRFTRHEVERFGKLLPAGALVVCSAAAANRDARIFSEPDRFIVDRRDLCQREPRGQYRADGLASGIAFGLGKPSIHPAIPEDRPRSRYALTRDTVVAISMQLIDKYKDIELEKGEKPHLMALSLGAMHTCWRLPAKVQ